VDVLLLARFAVESGKVTASVVKPKLFEPNRNLEISVSRIHGLRCSDIVEVGVDVVCRHQSAKRLYGWAELSATRIEESGLSIEHDDCPLRHSRIAGWPVEPEARKELQITLAARARPVRLSKVIEVDVYE